VKVTEKIVGNHTPAVLAVSLVAGLGVILMVTALAVGAIQGAAADSTVIGLVFAAGLALFLLGFGGWIGLAQPHRHFDDINIPAPDEHHHDDHTDEHAIVAASEQRVEQSHP
jgi:hypothetical protein